MCDEEGGREQAARALARMEGRAYGTADSVDVFRNCLGTEVVLLPPRPGSTVEPRLTPVAIAELKAWSGNDPPKGTLR